MPPSPIYEAIPTLRQAVIPALAALMPTVQDSTGRVKCYWRRAEQVDSSGQPIRLPYVIAQSQDGGGNGQKWTGLLEWQGLVTVRALAGQLLPAEQLLEQIVSGMDSLSYSGFVFRSSYERPIDSMPVEDGWQCGHIWRVAIGLA